MSRDFSKKYCIMKGRMAMKKVLAMILAFTMTNIMSVFANISGVFAVGVEDVAEEPMVSEAAQEVSLYSENYGRLFANINDTWKFKYEAADAEAKSTAFDDSSWQNVNLPHTWNADDGANGGTYARGKGWYRKQLNVPNEFTGKKVYLEFEGANALATLYVDGELVKYVDRNGQQVDSHTNGYTLFRYDITDYVTPGQTSLVTVCVDNTLLQTVSPIAGDFTMYGGLYRNVNLVAVEKTGHFDLMDNGSKGVYITATRTAKGEGASTGTWELKVEATVVNDTDTAKDYTVKSNYREPEEFTEVSTITNPQFDVSTMYGTEIYGTDTQTVHVQPNSKAVYTKTYTVQNPRLWDGRIDPYRYQVDVELFSGEVALDKLSQYTGFRTFYTDKEKGFFLNDRSYQLYGMADHQDYPGIGNALTNDIYDKDLELFYDIGATSIRLAHYPHNDYFYEIAEKYGFVLWAEVALISHIPNTKYDENDKVTMAFIDSVYNQATELVKQQYNRPGIVTWCMSNEVDAPYDEFMHTFMPEYDAYMHEIDKSGRFTSNVTCNTEGTYWQTDAVARNTYPLWYSSTFETLDETIIPFLEDENVPAMGWSEMGAGGGIIYHVEDAVANKPEAFGDRVHPEEYQTYVHETLVKKFATDTSFSDALWCKYIWCLHDFGSDSRSEGDSLGINDKGLVTFDRETKKDAYYVWKAYWSNNNIGIEVDPFIHIQRQRFNPRRDQDTMAVKVSSNLDKLTMKYKNESTGDYVTCAELTNDGTGSFEWSEIPVVLGDNEIVVEGMDNSVAYSESFTWQRVKSNNTEITSDDFIIDNTAKTLIFKSGIKAGEIASYVSNAREATFSVYNSDKITLVDEEAEIQPKMYLCVTAADGETKEFYQFVVANIAYEKTVTYNGIAQPILTDGIKEVPASAPHVNVCWNSMTTDYPFDLVIDLQNSYYINEISMSTLTKFGYRVYAGESLSDMTLVKDEWNNNTKGNITTTVDAKGRYIKISLVQGYGSASIIEIEVKGWRFANTKTPYEVDEEAKIIYVNSISAELNQVVSALELEGNASVEFFTDNVLGYAENDSTVTVTPNNGSPVVYTVNTGAKTSAPTSVSVKYPKMVLAPDTYEKIEFNVIPTDSVMPSDLTFTSSNTQVAAVTNDGVVTGVAKGTATITVSCPSINFSAAVDVTVGDKKLLSLNRPVSASDYETGTYPKRAEFVNDGANWSGSTTATDPNSVVCRWSTTKNYVEGDYPYITIDLERMCTIDSIDLELYSSAYNRYYYYNIYASDDNVKFTKITSVPDSTTAGNNKGKYTHTYSGVTARYIKLEGIGCDQGTKFGVFEMSVYGDEAKQDDTPESGENRLLSLNKPVTVSDYNSTGSYPKEAKYINNGEVYDSTQTTVGGYGHYVHHWETTKGYTEGDYPWVIIDLEDKYAIDSVFMETYTLFNGANEYYYNIYVSDDNTDYTLVTTVDATNTDNSGRYTYDYSDKNINGRYIKIVGTGCKDATKKFGLFEVSVYGSEYVEIPENTISFTSSKYALGLHEVMFDAVKGDLAGYKTVSKNTNVVEAKSGGVFVGIGNGTTLIQILDANNNIVDEAFVRVTDKKNLAMNKPIIEFSNIGRENNEMFGRIFCNDVYKLVDGHFPYTTNSDYNFDRWRVQTPKQTNGDWHYAIIDLEKVSRIEEFVIYGYAYSSLSQNDFYKISTSLDNVTYTPVCSYTEKPENEADYLKSFAAPNLQTPVEARYVKVELARISSAGNPDEVQFYEIAVKGSVKEFEAFRFTDELYCMGVGDKLYDVFEAADGVSLDNYTFVSEDSAVVAINKDGSLTAGAKTGKAIVKILDSKNNVVDACLVRVDSSKLISYNKTLIDVADEGESINGNGTSYKVQSIVDGSYPKSADLMQDRWQAGTQKENCVTVDLGRVCKLDSSKLVLYYGGNRRYGYKISTSLDNIEFTTAVDKLENPNMGYIMSDSLGGVYARYVKLQVTKSLDTTVYAAVHEFEIYGDDTALSPVTTSEKSVRVREPSGMRFGAFVTIWQDSFVDGNADEFGFVVTRKKLLADKGLSEQQFTVENANKNGVSVVYGKSKYYDEQKQDFKEIIWNDDFANSARYFTGVLIGIPESGYKDVFVARPYVLVDGVYYYGDVISASIYDVAKAIHEDKNNTPSEEVKAYIMSILGITEW